MRIQNVRFEESKNWVKLSATCKIRRVGQETVYFKFPKKYKKFIYADASPFAAALLLPSMQRGEDLIINGTISEKLYTGMHEIMKVVVDWNIGFKPIKIIADNTARDKGSPKLVTTCFSGGVDSFYTWLDHKNDKKNPVTSMLCVNGFDIGLHEEDLWNQTIGNIQTIAAEENAELIEAESNVRSFLDPIILWGYAHGGCLAAVALCLRKGIKTLYIPSSHTIDQRFPWGTDIALDPNWSTEIMNFVHDAPEVSRVNKVLGQVAKSPVALRYLRVCYLNQKGSYNCGVCDKCIRTMINLYVADALDRSSTFPTTLDNNAVANLKIHGDGGKFLHENLAVLEEQGRNPELQEALRTCLNQPKSSRTRHSKIKDGYIRLLYLDYMYTRSIVQRTLRIK